ncbi:5-hydroxytryptamine receptor 1F-like [Clytia hemisphaerica]|uniref:5-hydroxytryptamine receptor 1F-like n=1 Tax=Clytia hemisphaerica TaxID=252671 RepID=UPI0034D57F32
MYNNTTEAELSNNHVVLNCYHLSYVYVLQGWHLTVYYILLIAYVILALPTTIFNSVILYVYIGKNLRKHPSNLLIISIALADLLTGACSLPLGFVNLLLLVIQKEIHCLLYACTLFLAYTFCVLSFITVFYSSLDRYLAIFYPFFYSKHNWHRFYFILNILSWIFSITLVASSFNFELFKPVLAFLLSQPIIIIANIVLLVKVWRAVKKARKADLNKLVIKKISGEPSPYVIHKSLNQPQRNSDTNIPTKQQQTQNRRIRKNCSTEFYGNRQRKAGLSIQTVDRNVADYLWQLDVRQQRVQIKKDDQRTNRRTLLMLLSICICYLPYLLVVIWWMLDTGYSDTSHTVGSIAIFFVPIKALLNPVLYFYTMPSLRRRLKTTFNLKKGNTIDWRSTISKETQSADISISQLP